MDNGSTSLIWMAVVAVVVWAMYSFGQVHGRASIPDAFQPVFGDGEKEDHKCMVVLEKKGSRVVYAGCYGRLMLAEYKANFQAGGQPFPFRVVGEFDKELDNW